MTCNEGALLEFIFDELLSSDQVCSLNAKHTRRNTTVFCFDG